jgi:hypothetical protein
MVGFVLVPVGGWLAFSTLLGLFLGRVMARREDHELPARSVARHRPRRVA